MRQLILLSLIIQYSPINNNLEILGPSIINIPYYTFFTKEDILSMFNINGYYKEYQINPTPLYGIIGETNYVLGVIDYKNQIHRHNFSINIFDDVPPIISGPDILYLSHPLPNKNDILDYYTCNDYIDGKIYPYIYETNYNNEIKKEKLYMIIYASDNSKNIAKMKIKIDVKNDINDFYMQDNLSITVGKNRFLSAKEIIFLLQQEHKIENVKLTETKFIEIPENMFYKTGKYNIKISAIFNNKNYILNVLINVIDTIQKKESIIKIKFLAFINFIKKILIKIKNAFFNQTN